MQRGLLTFALLALLASAAVALNKPRTLHQLGISTVSLQTNRAVDVYDADEVANGVSVECRRMFLSFLLPK
jgi:acid phosphatase class B